MMRIMLEVACACGIVTARLTNERFEFFDACLQLSIGRRIIILSGSLTFWALSLRFIHLTKSKMPPTICKEPEAEESRAAFTDSSSDALWVVAC